MSINDEVARDTLLSL